MRGSRLWETFAVATVACACGSSDVDVIVRSTGAPAALPSADDTQDDTANADDAEAMDDSANDLIDADSGDDASADEGTEADAGQVLPPEEPEPVTVDAGAAPVEVECDGVSASLARYYRFTLRDDDRCMVLGEQLMGGNLPLYLPELSTTCEGDDSLWQLIQGLDGAFEVRHSQVALNLDVEMGSPDVGAPAVIVLPIGYPSQRWEFQSRSGGAAALRPLHTLDRCLAVGVTGEVELSLCVQGAASQEWVVEQVPCAQPQPLPPPTQSSPSTPGSP